MIVALRPPGAFPGSTLLCNGIFTESYVHFGDAGHWLRPYKALRDEAARCGITLVTEDMVDLAGAAALVLIDLPASLHELTALRRAYPNLKLILQTLETCHGRRWTFDPANHRLFDAVVSYNDGHANLEKYFIYKIPAGGIDGWPGPLRDLPWERRRLVSMVSTRYVHSPLHPLRTGIGVQLKHGWHLAPGAWWDYVIPNGSLFRAREVIAEAVAQAVPDDFDIFGPYWDTGVAAATSRCVRGQNAASKLEFLGDYRFTIAIENCRNEMGYISEKIFDPLLAGSVPVYLGNERIADYVPADAFVDIRKFSSFKDMALFLKALPRERWQEMRECGSNFLRGDGIASFGASQYADAMIGAIRFATR